MTVIGDKARFAVEFDLDEEPAGEWLNGSVKLWISARAVGERPSTALTSLRDYIGIFDEVVSGAGRRSNEALFSEATERAIEQLNGALFVGGDPSLEARALEEQWGLLLLDLAFPSVTVYGIEHADQLRLLVSEDDSSWQAFVPASDAYAVLAAARDALETLRQQLKGEPAQPRS